jgi:IS5 family transposase
LPGWFPHLPDQSQYNRRLRALVGLISIVQQRLARWLDTGDVRLSDGTLIGVANYPGCQRRSEFAGFARFGFAKSQHRFVYGVRLVLLTDARGLPLGYTIVPANEKEYEPLADLLTGTPAEVVIADKGLWGRAYNKRLAAAEVRLLTPDRTRTATNLGRERALASTRLVIESVFANLKGQMRLERHLARTPAGLTVRIPNASSRSRSECCSTRSAAAQHAPSPPTTAAKSHQRSTASAHSCCSGVLSWISTSRSSLSTTTWRAR